MGISSLPVYLLFAIIYNYRWWFCKKQMLYIFEIRKYNSQPYLTYADVVMLSISFLVQSPDK